MKKNLIIMTLCYLLIYTFKFPVSANEYEYLSAKSAQQFAERYFEQIVLNHVNSDDAPYYNLTKSTNITFGKLYERYRLSSDFVTTKKVLSDEQGIVKSTEYIAVVYQDGIPVNVIATAKDGENGEYVLSTFGYGKELAKALDAKSTNGGKIFYEAPADAWYIFENGKVSSFANSAKIITEQPLKLSEYRDYIYEKYASQQEIREHGQNTAVGGTFNRTYEEVTREKEFLSSTIKRTLLIGTVILLISYFALRNRRKQRE